MNSPKDRSGLAGADYSTITVTLMTPAITVVTPVVSGTLELITSPEGAGIVIDDTKPGQYAPDLTGNRARK